MNRMLAIAAAASALFAASGAQAVILLIDDFTLPTPVAQQAIADAGSSTAAPCSVLVPCTVSAPTLLPGTQAELASSRVIEAHYQGPVAAESGDQVKVTAGGVGGYLNAQAGTNAKGYVGVSWTLVPIVPPLAPNGNSFFFQVVTAAATGAQTGTPLNFFFQDKDLNPLHSFSFNDSVANAVNPTTMTFMLSSAESGFLSDGGSLSLTIGVPNLANAIGQWNVLLDSFSIGIPEPTSLALVGLALVGAGLASRRRKA